MTTITNSPASWVSVTSDQQQDTTFQKRHPNLWQKWLAIADGQANNRAMWFAASLVIMGVLFLPLPAILIYSYHAPIIVLVISMILFFANFVWGMGGSNIRTTLTMFAVSIIIYMVMAAICII